MSGIVGIWNLDGRPVDPHVFAAMSATMAHRGPDGEGHWLQGPAALACQMLHATPESLTEHLPLVHPRGTVLVWDGRLDNREELLAALQDDHSVTPASPDAELVLAAYHVYKEQLPERLQGDFALGLFDPEQQQLLFARDQLGVRPLYYTRAGDTVIFASEIKAILAHPQVRTRPNDNALGDFLLGGVPSDPRGETCFEGIFSLPPAHLGLVAHRRLATRRYWDFDPSRQIRLPSFDDYAAAFRHYFQQAVRRRLRSAYPVVTSVSGGLDSSAIFCLAETLRRASPARYPANLGISYTSGSWEEADESCFLADIEEKYALTIERLPLKVMGFFAEAKDDVHQIEHPLVDELGKSVEGLLRTSRERGARVLLSGLWGDQMLFPRGYLVDLFRRLAWREVAAHLREYRRWLTDVHPKYYTRGFFEDLVRHHTPGILRPLLRKVHRIVVGKMEQRNLAWYSARFRSQWQRARERARRIDRRCPSVHSKTVYEQATSRYYVQCMEWNNKRAALHGLEYAFPFLDRDLIEFLMAIPGEVSAWKGIPKALLRFSLGDVLPATIAGRTWKADMSRVVNQAMTLECDQVVGCLQANPHAVRRGYLDGRLLGKELALMSSRIGGNNCSITWRLSELLGLELWLQVFFSENCNDRRIVNHATA